MKFEIRIKTGLTGRDLQEELCHCLAQAAARIEALPEYHVVAGARIAVHDSNGQEVGWAKLAD